MASLLARGPYVASNEEGEVLAWKALEFAIDSGFTEIVLEGDNAKVRSNVGPMPP